MNNPSTPSLSKVAKESLLIFGQMIKAQRLERKISQKDLAVRLNVSRYTIIALEKGDPKVSIGAVFEAAYLVGIPLFEGNLDKTKANVSHLISLLPKRIRQQKEGLDNDF